MERAETITLIAGQDIDASSYPLAVFLLPDYDRADSSYKLQSSDTTSYQVYGANWLRQDISAMRDINQVTKVTLNLLRSGNPTGTFQVDLWRYNFKDDGTGNEIGWELVESAGLACSAISDSSFTDYDFSFSPAVTYGNDIMLVLSAVDGDSSNYIEVKAGDTITALGVNIDSLFTSDDSGGSWNNSSDFLYFDLHGEYVSFDTAERVYLCDFWQDSYEPQKMRFIGFVIKGQNVSAGNPIKVQIQGVIDGFGSIGLLPGKIYYPSHAAVGEIEVAPLEDNDNTIYFYNRFEILRALTATRGLIIRNNNR